MWLARDSVGAASYLTTPNSIGPWSYANLAPTRYVDPDGRCTRRDVDEGNCDELYSEFEPLVGAFYLSDIEAMSADERLAALRAVSPYSTIQNRDYSPDQATEVLCSLFDCNRGAAANLWHRATNSKLASVVSVGLDKYNAGWASAREGAQDLAKGAVFNALDSPTAGGFGNRANAAFADATTVPAGAAIDLARAQVDAAAIGGTIKFAGLGLGLSKQALRSLYKDGDLILTPAGGPPPASAYEWVLPKAQQEPFFILNKTHAGSMPKPKKLASGARVESHHLVQDDWAAANLSRFGWKSGKAPTITLEIGQGKAHSIISARQNARMNARLGAGKGQWSSTLQEELQYAVDDLKAAGFRDETINQMMSTQYRMLDALKVPYSPILVK